MGVHIILTGATGLIGSSVLSHILSLPAGVTATHQTISKLTILTRNTSIPLLSYPPPHGTPRQNTVTKIEVVEHKDFNVYDQDLLRKLNGADACIWALGVSQSAVDKDTYIKITKDHTLNAAKAFANLRSQKPPVSAESKDLISTTSSNPDSRRFKFIFISGEGATQSPGILTPLFGRVKGETESSLLSLASSPAYRDILSVYSARPGTVDGSNQPWLWDHIFQTRRTAAYRLQHRMILPPLQLLYKQMVAPTEMLGKVLVEMACEESRAGYDGPGVLGDGRILPNSKLRELGGF